MGCRMVALVAMEMRVAKSGLLDAFPCRTAAEHPKFLWVKMRLAPFQGAFITNSLGFLKTLFYFYLACSLLLGVSFRRCTPVFNNALVLRMRHKGNPVFLLL